ncbi:type II toxin-antitoxin system HicA family toxin [Synechococcus sp. PCC 7335]|uniref:type II toxin-antitoxin system HicA family toxin n=1 Tax=Synechococcus sp. (strain ATCC 29403 / PCC 7335) TaxID=91464 RepID=UPI0018DC806A|nr:type II toxin-antitoxin system HicA family toxin [Synechococcus sp. PCC 7335]
MVKLNSKQTKVYRQIWAKPTTKTLKFSDVDKLLAAIGCKRTTKGGANVVFEYDGHTWGMHPPHPRPLVKPPYVQQIRKFLVDSGIKQLIEENSDD